MHMKAADCEVKGAVFQGNLVRDRRLWIDKFTSSFAKNGLRDEWLAETVFIMDRVASADELHRHWDSDSWRLAALLIVLKMSEAEAELDNHVRDVMFGTCPELASEKLWQGIRDAEHTIYRLLDFRVFKPTALDVAGRVALDICAAALPYGDPDVDSGAWTGLAKGRIPAPTPAGRKEQRFSVVSHFVAMVSFLVELSVVHIPAEVYRTEASSSVLALAALHLALHTFGDPPAAAVKAFEKARQETIGTSELANANLMRLIESVHKLWGSPPSDSQVVKKWRSRQSELGGRSLLWAPLRPPPLALVAQEPVTPQRAPTRALQRIGSMTPFSEIAVEPPRHIEASVPGVSPPRCSVTQQWKAASTWHGSDRPTQTAADSQASVPSSSPDTLADAINALAKPPVPGGGMVPRGLFRDLNGGLGRPSPKLQRLRCYAPPAEQRAAAQLGDKRPRAVASSALATLTAIETATAGVTTTATATATAAATTAATQQAVAGAHVDLAANGEAAPSSSKSRRRQLSRPRQNVELPRTSLGECGAWDCPREDHREVDGEMPKPRRLILTAGDGATASQTGPRQGTEIQRQRVLCAASYLQVCRALKGGA